MTKTSTWAQRGKEALQNVDTTNEAPAGMRRAGRGSSGSGEEIIAFYQFNPSKSGNTKARVLSEGDTITGTYQGSFKDKTYGRYMHKVKTLEGLVTLPAAGQLDKNILTVQEGADVKVVYLGKQTIKAGRYAGKAAHTFDVFASAFKGQD